jgi:hypothetical protein
MMCKCWKYFLTYSRNTFLSNFGVANLNEWMLINLCKKVAMKRFWGYVLGLVLKDLGEE